MIIAIDGPAGAGKSTVAKILAQKMGFLYIDTGAMYRALTLKVLEMNIDIKDTEKISMISRDTNIDLVNSENGGLKVLLDGKDVSKEIRSPRITKHVSDIAKIKGVRETMVKLQQQLGSRKNSILDGRDIGTVVFPNADMKFFVDAKFEERTNRRFLELKPSIEGLTLEDVAKDLANRDKIDSTREIAPLKKADDAIYVDTTDLSIEGVVNKILSYLKA